MPQVDELKHGFGGVGITDISNQQFKVVADIPKNIGTIANVELGYGGIPLQYTMKQRDALPALIPEN